MNDEARAELRDLQARAYGRDGDIHDDPEALRRLDELQARIAVAELPVAEVEPVAPRETDASAPADSAGDTAGAADEPGDEASASTNRWRGWMPWLWAASVLLAAGIAASWNLAPAVVALFPLGGTGAKQVDVIPVDPSFEHWAALGDSSVEETGFVDFLGMTPIATVGGWFVGDPDGVCLAVVPTSDIESGSQSINGPFYSSCSAGPFRAVVQFVVTSDLPQEFLKRFPEGQAVQFVLDGERVGVFTPAD